MNHPLLEDEGAAIRDPVWGYIHVPSPLLALIDTEDFQRLRNISQLGFVHLVYPGARHSRFEHSLGVYHLAKQFLARLVRSDPPLELSEEDVRVFLAAALLHDIGHYPFSHTLEELTPFFVDHEERGRQLIEDERGSIAKVLRDELAVDPVRVANVIDYRSTARDIPPASLFRYRVAPSRRRPAKRHHWTREEDAELRYSGAPPRPPRHAPHSRQVATHGARHWVAVAKHMMARAPRRAAPRT